MQKKRTVESLIKASNGKVTYIRNGNSLFWTDGRSRIGGTFLKSQFKAQEAINPPPTVNLYFLNSPGLKSILNELGVDYLG